MFDAQPLLRLISNNEKLPKRDFDLSNFIRIKTKNWGYTECGTAYCLVGGDLFYERYFFDNIKSMNFEKVSTIYNIPLSIAYYLFADEELFKDSCGFKFGSYDMPFFSKLRPNKAKQKALNRVRKYVYLKLHQNEIM